MGRILLADDDEDIVSLLQRALTGAGHEVVTAKDGQEALKLGMNETFDLYIFDVRMPRLDGYSLSLSITKKFPDKKVLLITGLDTSKYEPMAKASGAAGVISKPIDIPQFQKLVKAHLPA